MRHAFLVALLTLVSAVVSFAADPQPPATPLPSAAPDSSSMRQAKNWPLLPEKENTVLCYRMRTYRVRKNIDPTSVIQVHPDEVTFDPDTIVGYSTCQRAAKFDLHTTH